jgi:sec-independent protein translocase protein TatA
MLGSLGTPEILLIIFSLILLFGGKKIPELAKGIGKGIKELKNSIKDDN